MHTSPMKPVGPPDETLFFTVVETANLLRVSAWTINELIQRGQLESVKLGRRRFVPRVAVDKFVTRITEDTRGGHSA